MSFEVEFRPSGRRFVVEHGETVLEGALRSGLSPDYGCANGTCGDCLGRLIEGDVEPARFSDFALREAERGAGAFLLCANAPRTDLVVEAREAASADDIAQQSLRARVQESVVLDGAIALRLKVIRGGVLRFLAGQRVRLATSTGIALDHALASCPCDGVNLEFHLDPGAPDPVSAFAALGKNAKLSVDGPTGGVTFDEGSDRPLLFICTGSGFGPIKGIVEHVINLELERSIRLVRMDAGAPYLHHYCRSWADAFDDFVYTVADPPPCSGSLAGALSGVPAEAFDVYGCGSADFLAGVRATLAGLGCRPERTFLSNPTG